MTEDYTVKVTKRIFCETQDELIKVLSKLDEIDTCYMTVDINRNTDEYGNFSGDYTVTISSDCAGLKDISKVMEHAEQSFNDLQITFKD